MTRYNAYSRAPIIQASIFTTLAVLAVVLRFLARLRSKQPFGADDYCALMALLFLGAYNGIYLWNVEHGDGYALTPVLELPYPVLVQYLKNNYAAGPMTPACITCAKLSILFLYNRLFYSRRDVVRWVKLLGVICILWWIAATVTILLQCTPIRKSWNPIIKGHCFNFKAFMVGIEVPNALVDFLMMLVPLGVLRTLQMRLRYKISLAFIFFLGGFVGIIGFIRIGIVYTSFKISSLGIWISIQLEFAVICCCLPTFKPLFPKADLFNAIKQRYASILGRGTTAASSKATHNEVDGSLVPKSSVGYNRFDNNSNNSSNHEWVVPSSKADIVSQTHNTNNDFAMHSINVQRTVDVV